MSVAEVVAAFVAAVPAVWMLDGRYIDRKDVDSARDWAHMISALARASTRTNPRNTYEEVINDNRNDGHRR